MIRCFAGGRVLPVNLGPSDFDAGRSEHIVQSRLRIPGVSRIGIVGFNIRQDVLEKSRVSAAKNLNGCLVRIVVHVPGQYHVLPDERLSAEGRFLKNRANLFGLEATFILGFFAAEL